MSMMKRRFMDEESIIKVVGIVETVWKLKITEYLQLIYYVDGQLETYIDSENEDIEYAHNK